MDAEDGIFAPWYFPGNVALSRFGEEPPATDGVDYPFSAIEAGWTPPKGKEFIST
jgi:hypothetical protein